MLGDCEHNVGGGNERVEAPADLVAHHLGQHHRDWLSQHDRLGLDAPDAPADDAQPVDHGGVRVGADDAVRVEHVAVGEADARQVLQVDLVHNAGAGRHDQHVLEGSRAPFEEEESLAVALELQRLVLGPGLLAAGKVHLHRVVDDQVRRALRVDQLRVSAHPLDGVAHRREVDDGRHAGVVLQEDARRPERHLHAARHGLVRLPGEDLVDVSLMDLRRHRVIIVRLMPIKHRICMYSPGSCRSS